MAKISEKIEAFIIKELSSMSGLHASKVANTLKKDASSTNFSEALHHIKNLVQLPHKKQSHLLRHPKYTDVFTPESKKIIQSKKFKNITKFIEARCNFYLEHNLFFKEKTWLSLPEKEIYSHLKKNGFIRNNPTSFLKNGHWCQQFTNSKQIISVIQFEKNIFQSVVNESLTLISQFFPQNQSNAFFELLQKNPQLLHYLSDISLTKKKLWALYLAQIEKTYYNFLSDGTL